MDVLSALTPRQAGAQIVEPQVGFDVVEQAAHSAERCPISCVCMNNTHLCTGTGVTGI